jgi:xanthine dehydrogenase C subunit
MVIGNYEYSDSPFVWQPNELEEARRLKEKLGKDACFVSGGTLLRTQWESNIAAVPKHLISLESIRPLYGIQLQADAITIGTMTSLNDCYKHPLIKEKLGLLSEAIRNIAAPSIRNIATIGGNIVSSVGDSIPSLLVYDAQLCWFDNNSQVTKPIETWLDGIKNAEPIRNELILTQVKFPLSNETKNEANQIENMKHVAFYHKVGRREAFTPSLVTVAVNGYIDSDGTLVDFRLAASGGSAHAMRLTDAESILNGNPFTKLLKEQAYQAIFKQFETYTDPFATSDYRKKVAANLIIAGLWKAAEPKE